MNALVELHAGYGDGYGIVAIDANGQPIEASGRNVKTYGDGYPLEPWKQKILAKPTINLIDSGVAVPVGAVKRVVGPTNCPEAARVLATRYTRNWVGREFVAQASDEELLAAMSCESERDTFAAMDSLRSKYQAV